MQRAIISGGTGYLGYEVAKTLAHKGVQVALLYFSKPESEVEGMLAQLEGEGHRAYLCDFSRREDIERAVALAEQELGPLTICVHAAYSGSPLKQLHITTENELEELFLSNVYGSFTFLTECTKRFKERKAGVLIGITTAGVQKPVKARGAYTVAKYALQGMLVALKDELTPYGIRTYSVAPGFMEGGLNKDLPRAFVEMVRASSPTGRITTPQEVAEKIGELCLGGEPHVQELTIVIAPETP